MNINMTTIDLPLLEVSKPPYQGILAAHPSNLYKM
jgi:hypothetical protein